MVWIYLVESEGLALHLKNGSDHYAIAKSIPIVKQSSLIDSLTVYCLEHPYGMTLIPYSFEQMEGVSTLSTEDSPVRTLVLQEMEKAWKEREADCFSRSYAWPKKSSPNSYFLRTYQPLQLVEEYRLLDRLPKWGMIVGGVVYPLYPLEHPINEYGGFYLPTPTASQAAKPIRKPSPSRLVKKHGYDIQDKLGEIYPNLIGMKINIHFLEWMMGYPTNWTELEDWGIQWFQSKLEKHLKS